MIASPGPLERAVANPAFSAPRPSIWTVSSCLKLHLFAVLVCAVSWEFLPPEMSLVLNGCVIGVVYSWLGITELRRGPLWLTPLSVFFFFYGLEMGLATVYVGFALQSNPWLPFAATVIPANDLATAYLIALVGMLAMHGGLEWLRPRPSRNPPTIGVLPFPFLSFGFLLLGAVVAIYRPLVLIQFGMLGIILQYGGLAALLALAFVPSRQLRISRVSHGILFAVGTCGLLAASAASQNSSKMEILLALLPVSALLIHARRFKKWLVPAAVLALFLYLGLVAPAINNSRAIATVEGMTTWDKVVQSAQAYSFLAHGQSTSDLLSEQYGNLMMRMFEPPSATGFIVGEVARNGLRMGSTMRDLEYAFIPRILWPEKPVVSRGTWFTTYVGLAPRPEEATTSTGMTAFGEWYWNFGMVGEIVGMFLTGILLGGLWRMAGSYPVFQPVQMLLYAAVLVDTVMLPEASSVLVTAIALYALFGCAVLWRGIVHRRALRFRPFPGACAS